MENHPWIPNLNRDSIEDMLRTIGAESIEELFEDIPASIRLKEELNVGMGRALSEPEVDAVVMKHASAVRGREELISFLGGGVWPHHVPAAVRAIVTRSEYYTSYTPYQAEISQGVLQALFEYQSLMADLLEMGVVNASMYDWSTALAEAVLMSVRVTGRSSVVVPSTMNPQHLEVLRTVTMPKGIQVIKIGYDKSSGLIDTDELRHVLKERAVAAVYIENPSFLGFIEEQVDEIESATHSSSSLFIVGVDPISLGVLRPPGDYGADIVVGEAQPLGLGMNYGGPLLGIFAVRDDLKMVRNMPGRLIGATTTIDGERIGYTMILQTREQHIRREKATSNICTNEALCAIASAVYLALLGPKGLEELGRVIISKSHYAAKRLGEVDGVESPALNSSFFKEFVVRYGSHKAVSDIHRQLLDNHGILAGLDISKPFRELGNVSLVCVTEVHTKEQIDLFAEALREVVR